MLGIGLLVGLGVALAAVARWVQPHALWGITFRRIARHSARRRKKP